LLVLVLQRAPQLISTLVPRLSLPAVQIVQKAIFTAAALGGAHAVSGASETQYRVNDSRYRIRNSTILHPETAKVGDTADIAISNSITAGSWELVQGQLPDGLRLTDFLEQAEMVEGTINASSLLILGTFTKAGNFGITLKPYSEANLGGSAAPQNLTITFEIAEGQLTAPDLSYSRTELHLILSWNTADGQGFELKRSDDLATWTIASPLESVPDGDRTSVTLPLDGSASEFYRLEVAQ